MTWKPVVVYLATLIVLATILTVWINMQSAHLFGEANLSTGEFLSENWWHPLLRLGAMWLWLLALVSAFVAGLVWLVGRFLRVQSRWRS